MIKQKLYSLKKRVFCIYVICKNKNLCFNVEQEKAAAGGLTCFKNVNMNLFIVNLY